MTSIATLFSQVLQTNQFEFDAINFAISNEVRCDGFHYTQYRSSNLPNWEFEKSGILVYNGDEKYIQTFYAINENDFFNQGIKLSDASNESLLINIKWTDLHFNQFISEDTIDDTIKSFLNFQHPQISYHKLTMCSKTQHAIDLLKSNDTNAFHRKLLIHAQSQMLLLYGIEESFGLQKDERIICKFLSNDVDRDKIFQAKNILLQQLGSPITIKELSKKVALNECYLKKGFKEIVGCTIFEFYQTQKMIYAKSLLLDKGLNVTEVSDLLGYSSISHFSTAFRKHTGLKPCELI